jgi:hypothetical protein
MDNYDNYVKDLYEKGKASYKAGNFEEALQYFNNFVDGGKIHFNHAVAKRFETSIDMAEQSFRDVRSWFNAGENWLREGVSWLNKGVGNAVKDVLKDQFIEKLAEGYYYWGYTLTYLARAKMRDRDKENDQAMDLFKDGLKKYEESITLKWRNSDLSYDSKMAAFYRMYNISNNEEYKDEAKKCLKKTKKDILGILVWLDGDVRDKIADNDFFYDMLDDESRFDGRFFKQSMGCGELSLCQDVYKKMYIHSIYIISRLYVDTPFENVVAHYREKEISQKMIFEDAKLRLNAVDYSNDSYEGKVLLNYLFGDKVKNKTFTKVYGAFAGCFSFNCDNLNQFRLYGKKEKNEGTGLSLVFRKDFFSDKVKLAIAEDDKEDGYKKFTLFRCIYFNQAAGCVEAVGQKERDRSNGNGYEKYHKRINRIISEVNAKLMELRDNINLHKQNLNHEIVGQLLINLRYLIKDMGFQYEQECRILKIYHLFDGKDKIRYDKERDYKMYIEYEPDVSKHLEKIYFGPKTTGKEIFEDFLVYKGFNKIICEKSSGNLD